jgi:hypothetical protein
MLMTSVWEETLAVVPLTETEALDTELKHLL